MKTEEEFGDMLKTLMVLTPTEANGWDAQIKDIKACSGDMVFLYLFDQPTMMVRLVAIDRKEFRRALSIAASLSDDDRNNVRGGLIYGVVQLAERQLSGPEKDEQENALGAGMALYACGTRTYQLAEKTTGDVSHFLILVYRKAGSLDAYLRPVVFPMDSGSPVTTEQLADTIKDVMEIDRDRHPEWFA